MNQTGSLLRGKDGRFERACLIWPIVCNMPIDLGPILKSKSDEKLLKSHHTIETLIAAVRVVKTFTVKNSLQ